MKLCSGTLRLSVNEPLRSYYAEQTE